MSGNLTTEQLAAVMETIPVEISFVDQDDLVRFWNKHETRIFRRPLSVEGKNVRNCHPAKSVDKVLKILSDFKSGKRNVAEFWINLQGKIVYIRYFPVRDASGSYLGTLEVSQDITAIQKLSGEKRLLDD
jgi:PAS domain S-box-containing protein